MLQTQQQSNVPEIVAMEIRRACRVPVNGVITEVWPGSVVEVDRALAVDLRMANKAVMVESAPKLAPKPGAPKKGGANE